LTPVIDEVLRADRRKAPGAKPSFQPEPLLPDALPHIPGECARNRAATSGRRTLARHGRRILAACIPLKSDMVMKRTPAPHLTAIVGGVTAVVATDMLTEYLRLEDSLALWGIAGAAFFIVALCVGLQSPERWRHGATLIAVGITLGVIVDAVLQEGFRNHSRNLWPFAVIFFLMLAVPTAGIGLILGRAIANRRALPSS